MSTLSCVAERPAASRRLSYLGFGEPNCWKNALLAGLTSGARALIARHIDERDLREGTCLWEAGDPIGHVYFPISGMVSILVDPGKGHGIEVATIGREGAAGIPRAADTGNATTRAVTQIPGRFASIPVSAFLDAARQSREIRGLAAAADNWMLLQAQQLAACNAAHTAEARLCRWLALTSDAIASEMIPVTQEAIGQVLGIRRTTVTLLAQQMQTLGLISYRRGHILIRNRAGLEAGACHCCSVLGRARQPSRSVSGDGSGEKAQVAAAD
jgi:CRP-like cAMP-binding protein